MPNYRRVYARGHSYFLTIVTHNRQPILVKNIDFLRTVFAESKSIYTYDIHAIVILPDHLHMIIEPQNSDEYPKIVSYLKRKFTYLLHQSGKYTDIHSISPSKVAKRESNIWQRRYYEHTIRNEKDFNLHMDYIHYNPVKHQYVDAAYQWKHSSFHKYLKLDWYTKEWCNFSNDYSLGE